jgi:hypothetical protein
MEMVKKARTPTQPMVIMSSAMEKALTEVLLPV